MAKRATISYIVMLALFVAGQYAIVESGTHLKAAPDITGVWQLSPDPDSTAYMPPGSKMTISQSGKFLDVHFDNGVRVPARIEVVSAENSNEELHLTGTKYIFNAKGKSASGQLRCFLQVPNWVTLPFGPVDVTVGKSLNDYSFIARKEEKRPN